MLTAASATCYATRESWTWRPPSNAARSNSTQNSALLTTASATCCTIRASGDEAAAEFRTAIQLDPRKAIAHNNLGKLLNDQGKREEAAAEFRKAIDLDHKYVAPHNGLGKVLFDKREWKEAAAEFNRAIQLDPKEAEYHGELGLVLFLQGQFIGAKQSFQRCLELLPVNDVRRKFTTENLQRCEQMIALDKKLPAIRKGDAQPAGAAEQVNLAGLCYLSKRYAEAARFYAGGFAAQPALAEDPTNE